MCDLWLLLDVPGGLLPVLYTADGCLNQSTVIARYVARKVGIFNNQAS